MWFDFSYSHMDWGWAKGKGKNDWDSERLMTMVRELQPHILVNDRLEIGGDLKTPEQYQPAGKLMVDGAVLWEACLDVLISDLLICYSTDLRFYRSQHNPLPRSR